jgi:2-amino-4-hydroxy-6-hydroxymethyldihydropteridine diphosphokinase
VIGIGSNIDPRSNVDRALEIVDERFERLSTSRFVWTDPIGRPEQARYLNGAVLIETDLSHEALVRDLRDIEARMGRRRGPDKYAPRRIDLDVAVYDGQVVDPDVHTRSFLRQVVEEVLGAAL